MHEDPGMMSSDGNDDEEDVLQMPMQKPSSDAVVLEWIYGGYAMLCELECCLMCINDGHIRLDHELWSAWKKMPSIGSRKF